jgi:hypothetical protein
LFSVLGEKHMDKIFQGVHGLFSDPRTNVSTPINLVVIQASVKGFHEILEKLR